MKSKIVISIIPLLLVIVVGLLILVPRINVFMHKSRIENILTFSNQFEVGEQIAESRYCWDDNDTCGTSIYFTTPMTIEEINSLLLNDSRVTSKKTSFNGYNIFTDINLNTNKTFMVNGQDGLLNRSDIVEPDASVWNLEEGGQKWSIVLYELPNVHEICYELDRMRVQDNVMIIMLID